MLLLRPKDYWESFIRLSQVGVLDSAAARSFARLAGLRNRITHEYNGLDERLIHEALGRIVREFPAGGKRTERSLMCAGNQSH